ncbi:hypothetical protein THOM_3000 [Trachipleistophora hominis]|uniref:Uncharacterized protein n=1 Tax=Trachipleistophora hominis TaxID=72359 RepID=L7JRP6_TRAHO|nr:hypothetical protein THOM_3000 [Trachipleistophora hominis]
MSAEANPVTTVENPTPSYLKTMLKIEEDSNYVCKLREQVQKEELIELLHVSFDLLFLLFVVAVTMYLGIKFYRDRRLQRRHIINSPLRLSSRSSAGLSDQDRTDTMMANRQAIIRIRTTSERETIV